MCEYTGICKLLTVLKSHHWFALFLRTQFYYIFCSLHQCSSHVVHDLVSIVGRIYSNVPVEAILNGLHKFPGVATL